LVIVYFFIVLFGIGALSLWIFFPKSNLSDADQALLERKDGLKNK
jgi:hypothetical protein